jgi:hypothetical protein
MKFEEIFDESEVRFRYRLKWGRLSANEREARFLTPVSRKIVEEALVLQERLEDLHPGGALAINDKSIFVGEMSEAEILTRAREAAISVWTEDMHPTARAGRYDSGPTIKAVIRALRDLSKPLSEIVSDPDKEEARSMAKECGFGAATQEDVILAAIKRGRALEREGK